MERQGREEGKGIEGREEEKEKNVRLTKKD